MALAYTKENISKDEKKDIVTKLNRIEGRIRGISKMVDDDRSTEEIMMQVSASYESLRVVMKTLIKNHMEQSITTGLISTNQTKRDETYDKLLSDIFKYVR